MFQIRAGSPAKRGAYTFEATTKKEDMAANQAAKKPSDKSRQSEATTALPDSLDASIEALAAATASLQQLQAEDADISSRIKDTNRQKKAAATNEEYERAADLKKQAESLETTAARTRQALTVAAEARRELTEHTGRLYFATARSSSDIKEVTRVVVVDPVTGSSDEAYYLDSDDTIQLTLSDGGLRFESEAWHVDSWAVAEGLLVQRRKRSVDFGGATD